MKRELIQTADGSWTIQLPDWNEQYHSKHGAIAEAKHVFIQSGLKHYYKNSKFRPISILEIGFGTGLNALLSLQFADSAKVTINYAALEAYPVAREHWCKLDYARQLQMDPGSFTALHTVPWEQAAAISSHFTLCKQQQQFDTLAALSEFDLIYYDAFGPRVQPQLWNRDMLERTVMALKPGGVWVSYCAKGDVRRDLQGLGMQVERLQGPPGKRHMLRAQKLA